MTCFQYSTTCCANRHRICVPTGLEDKTVLLRFFHHAFRFPDWFGYNWDAFIDCMRDIESPDGEPFAIVHSDVPFAKDPHNLQMYLDVLLTVCIENGAKFEIVFPEVCQPLIEEQLVSYWRRKDTNIQTMRDIMERIQR